MKQRGFVLLPVIIILLVGVLGYFIYQNTKLQRDGGNSTFTPVMPTTNLSNLSPTTEPVENWKTFTSQNLNVSFQYPSFFRVIETIAQPSPLGYMIFGEIDLKKFPTTSLTNPTRKQILIMTIKKTEADYYLRIKIGDTYTDPNLNQGFITLFDRLPDMIIGGLKSYVYKDYAEKGVYYDSGKIIIVKKGDIYYQITIPFSNFSSDTPSEVPGKDIDYVTIFQEMLSTIKFIQ